MQRQAERERRVPRRSREVAKINERLSRANAHTGCDAHALRTTCKNHADARPRDAKRRTACKRVRSTHATRRRTRRRTSDSAQQQQRLLQRGRWERDCARLALDSGKRRR